MDADETTTVSKRGSIDMAYVYSDLLYAYSFLGVPRIIENTLPEPLNPDRIDSDTNFFEWVASSLIHNARININIRQVF
jgi:hypothetical protein